MDEKNPENKVPSKGRRPKDEEYTSIFDAPAAVPEKQPKKRRISKRTVNTIIALAVCVALGAAAFGATKLWGKDDVTDEVSSDETSETETTEIFNLGDYSYSATKTDDLKMGPITNVVVKNEHDTFAIVPTVGKTTSTDSVTGEETEKDTTVWKINAAEKTNISGIEFNDTRVSFILGEALALVLKALGQEEAAVVAVLHAFEQHLDGQAVQISVEALFDKLVGLLHALHHGAALARRALGAGGGLRILLERLHDLQHGDVGRLLGQPVAAVLARPRLDEARVAQQLGQLDEIVPRYGHVLRDIFGGARGTLCGQVQDGAHAIVRRCLELHDVS